MNTLLAHAAGTVGSLSLEQNRGCKSWPRHCESVCYQPGNKGGAGYLVIEQSLSFSFIGVALFHVVMLNAAFVTLAGEWTLCTWNWSAGASFSSKENVQNAQLHLRDEYYEWLKLHFAVLSHMTRSSSYFSTSSSQCFLDSRAVGLLLSSPISLHLGFLMCQRRLLCNSELTLLPAAEMSFPLSVKLLPESLLHVVRPTYSHKKRGKL